MKGLRAAGVVTAWHDAIGSVSKARNNPTFGNVAKAALKVGLAAFQTFGKVNPVVGIVTGILDIIGL